MCGRFTLTLSTDELARFLDVGPTAFDEAEYRPRYNIAPTQPHWILRQRREAREVCSATWGLVNHWARDNKRAAAQINARVEDLDRRKSFRQAFAQRRCLVPADGFFEWTGSKNARQPLWFHRPDGGLLLFAGLYESWRPAADRCERTFTIITTDANATVAPIHDRMPLILDGRASDDWIFEGHSPSDVRTLLGPPADHHLIAEPVSRRVNNVINDDPDCLTVHREFDVASQGALFG